MPSYNTILFILLFLLILSISIIWDLVKMIKAKDKVISHLSDLLKIGK